MRTFSVNYMDMGFGMGGMGNVNWDVAGTPERYVSCQVSTSTGTWIGNDARPSMSSGGMFFYLYGPINSSTEVILDCTSEFGQHSQWRRPIS